MLEILVTIGLAWVVSNVRNIDTLLGEGHERVAAIIALALGLLVSSYAGWETYKRIYTKHIHRPEGIQQALQLNEASGGTTLGGTAYVVDDETPALFVSDSISDEGYFTDFRKLDLKDANDRVLTKDDVDDLEGAAADPRGRVLYLVTSHSNNKNSKQKPERQQLLQIDLTTKTEHDIHVKARADLRIAIENLLWPSEAGREDQDSGHHKDFRRDDKTSQIKNITSVMEIEGLAMDDKGVLYFGFRAPRCPDGGAIILSAPADAIFTNDIAGDKSETRTIEDPNIFTRYCVGTGDRVSGITSMEFDPETHDILVLTGSPNLYEVASPTLCRWSSADPQRLRSCNNLPQLEEPKVGKQEALLLVRSKKRVITLLDTDKGLGGQVSYTLREAGLR
jgi:hypothetical protein